VHKNFINKLGRISKYLNDRSDATRHFVQIRYLMHELVLLKKAINLSVGFIAYQTLSSKL